MIYTIGDKFIIGKIEGKVVYINNGMAWLVPTQGITWIVFTRLDEKGYTQDGVKAECIQNTGCMAV